MHCSAGSEIRQILQGVTEWIASMVDDQADPFGDLASFEQSGEMSSITAHVAEVISQMAGTLNDLGANEDMDVEITYELDLAVRTHTVCVWSSCTSDIQICICLTCAQLYVLVSSINAIKAVSIGMTANRLLAHHCTDTCLLHRLLLMLRLSISALK